MIKERQAHVRAEIIGRKLNASFYGTEEDVAHCFERSAVILIERHPTLRRKLRRAMCRAMWQTLPDWIHYLLDDWPLTVVGAGILGLAIYGLSWVCHWMGVV